MRLPPPDLTENLTPAKRFREHTRRVMSVTPQELVEREKTKREAAARGKRKAGPRPKNSANDK